MMITYDHNTIGGMRDLGIHNGGMRDWGIYNGGMREWGYYTFNLAWQARRVAAILDTLKKHVAPKVCAAYFSTLWNRWSTYRRWQGKCNTPKHCLMCEDPDTEDAIEHYAHCPIVKQAMLKYLNIDPYYHRNTHTLYY